MFFRSLIIMRLGVVLFIIIFLGVCSISWCFGHLGENFWQYYFVKYCFCFILLSYGWNFHHIPCVFYVHFFFSPFGSPCSSLCLLLTFYPADWLLFCVLCNLWRSSSLVSLPCFVFQSFTFILFSDFYFFA